MSDKTLLRLKKTQKVAEFIIRTNDMFQMLIQVIVQIMT
jgi:hypothetical protein